MKTMLISAAVATLLSILVLPQLAEAQESGDSSRQEEYDGDDSVKVFILAGQSNMVGHAAVDHLMELIDANSTWGEPNIYREALWDEEQDDFKEIENVYIKFGQNHGPLKVGYGEVNSGTHYAAADCFGPEALFGATIAKVVKEPVYLIKAAWGGRDLAIDFRPPSSGAGTYRNIHDEDIKPSHYGWTYREMMTEIQESLNLIQHVVPGYIPEAGYQIMGLVWFQGWNDVILWPKVDEYKENLENMIRDVRRDLDLPHLPWVIGELGMLGENLPEGDFGKRHKAMRLNAESVTYRQEFADNTMYVPTAHYVTSKDETYENDYHYFGRADTCYHIGAAFGEAMLKLMGVETEVDTSD